MSNEIFRLHCPNCGFRLSGIRAKDGQCRISCPVCGTRVINREFYRHHFILDVYENRR